MISLANQCAAFLHLAIRGDLYTTDSQEEYHAQLHMQKYDSAWDIIDFLHRWKTKPFFKIQDVVPLVEQLPQDAIGLDALSKFAKYPELIDIAAKHILQSDRLEYMRIEPKIDTYLYLETVPVSDHILKEYQRLILKNIMELLNRMKEEGKSWWFREMLRALAQLFQKSTKFPKNLLEGLFKRFGLENYIGLISTPEHYQTALNRDIITKWDAAIIIRNSDQYFIKDTFLDILNKCDGEAKEYFRGFIYADSNFRDFVNTDEYFMLSEDMTPMDRNLKQKAWPGGFFIHKLSHTPDKIQKMWGPIFADFGILTH